MEKEKAALASRLDEAQSGKKAAQILAREASESRQEFLTKVESSNSSLDSMQLDVAEARAAAEQAENRAERLVRRVNELEHQVSVRAAELAKALGHADSSEILRSSIE